MGDAGDVKATNASFMALLLFFLLTFAVTWVAWLAPALLATAGNAGLFGLGGPVFLLGVFAPAMVALALTAHSEGRVGVARLLSRIGKWQASAHLYLFALGYMAASKLLAALIHRLIMGEWPVFGDTPLLLMVAAILVSTLTQAGEEVGWRGYAMPRLARRLGLGGASLVLGLIWALWHLPLFYLPGSGSDGQSFPIYLLHVTALSVAMSWLYWKTNGSLLLVMLMHASVNNTTGIVPAAMSNPAGPLSFEGTLVAWATVGVSWLIAVLLLKKMQGASVDDMISADSRASGKR